MKLDLNIGDTVLTGKFKNKKVVIENFGTDDKGQPTFNGGKKMLTFRIQKLMPKKEEKLKEAIKKEVRKILVEYIKRKR